MKNLIKDTKKLAGWFFNGYLERDYSYLEKGIFERSFEENMRLNLVISSVDKAKMYGGLTTAVNMYDYLCGILDCDRRMIVTSDEVTDKVMAQYPEYCLQNADEDSEKRKVISNFCVENGKRKGLSVRAKEIFVATHWSTFYIISDVLAFQREKFQTDNHILYLIQDFEPGFYQWSTEYLLADSTYRAENTVAIFNSFNLKDYFKQLNYKFEYTVAFEPRLNQVLLQHLKLIDTMKRKKQVIVYGRPHVARNSFSIIVGALNRLIEKYQPGIEWEFLSIGGKHKDVKLSGGRVLKGCGKLTLEEYAKILAQSSVGISLMCSPHPSYPPLEMSTFGVVTITNSFLCKDLSEFNENIVSLDIVNFETVAEALHAAMSKYTETKRVSKKSKYLELDNQFVEVGTMIQKVIEK